MQHLRARRGYCESVADLPRRVAVSGGVARPRDLSKKERDWAHAHARVGVCEKAAASVERMSLNALDRPQVGGYNIF